MPKCPFLVAPAFAAGLFGTVIALSANRVLAAAECIEQPDREPAAGEHWHYRTDRLNNRKCWYLTEPEPVTPEAGAKSGAAQRHARSHSASRGAYGGLTHPLSQPGGVKRVRRMTSPTSLPRAIFPPSRLQWPSFADDAESGYDYGMSDNVFAMETVRPLEALIRARRAGRMQAPRLRLRRRKQDHVAVARRHGLSLCRESRGHDRRGGSVRGGLSVRRRGIRGEARPGVAGGPLGPARMGLRVAVLVTGGGPETGDFHSRRTLHAPATHPAFRAHAPAEVPL